MSESILQSIKKLLGLSPDYTEFDQDIILYINTALFSLTQIGVGEIYGTKIISAQDIWSDVVDTSQNLEGIKSYVHLKVKLMFDPPTNSRLVDAINESLKELEWRINVQTSFNTEVIK